MTAKIQQQIREREKNHEMRNMVSESGVTVLSFYFMRGLCVLYCLGGAINDNDGKLPQLPHKNSRGS